MALENRCLTALTRRKRTPPYPNAAQANTGKATDAAFPAIQKDYFMYPISFMYDLTILISSAASGLFLASWSQIS